MRATPHVPSTPMRPSRTVFKFVFTAAAFGLFCLITGLIGYRPPAQINLAAEGRKREVQHQVALYEEFREPALARAATATDPAAAREFLAQEQSVRNGLFAAGFISEDKRAEYDEKARDRYWEIVATTKTLRPSSRSIRPSRCSGPSGVPRR